MHLYFAYGMNLDPRYMPEGSEQVGAATLDGWQFDFRFFADIQPVEDATVHGGLWRVTDEGLRQLDGREGYHPGALYDGLYDRREVEVDCDGTTYTAIVYFMTARSLARGLAEPGIGYLEMLEHGYEVFGLDLQLLLDALRRCGAKHLDEVEA